MELELSRVDYAVVGVTSTNCMKILPKTLAHETQRVRCIGNYFTVFFNQAAFRSPLPMAMEFYRYFQ